MKTFVFPLYRELLLPAPAPAPVAPLPLTSLEKLTDLTHQFQHLLRYKPQGLSWILPYYHYFLNLKEKMEHHFTSSQESTAGGTAETRGKTLARLHAELAALLGPASPQHLKKKSPALFVLFQELEMLLMENNAPSLAPQGLRKTQPLNILSSI